MRWSILFLAILASCNSSSTGGVPAINNLHVPTTQVNVPTNDDDYYVLPFPNNLRLRPDGTVNLDTYPRSTDPGTLVYQYVDTFNADLHGFGENSGIYFRFGGPIDPATLPADANASTQSSATAYVVDVTPGSPTYGQKSPVIAHFVTSAYDFIGPNWLCLLPFPGIPLREKTTYAAILTDGIRGAGGEHIDRAHDLDVALQKNSSSDPTMAAAQTVYKPLADYLATNPDVAKHLVNATVFTTRDATSLMFALRKAIYDNVPEPTLLDLAYGSAGTNYDEFEAHYSSPNFQQGDVPYTTSGGQIVTDENGVPQVVRTEDLRLAITIPQGQMPAAGWPVVIYAHGTGGDYHSFLGDGSAADAALVTDASGKTISKLAMVGIDQVLHGPRDPSGSNPDYTFFNFQNPAGAKYNPLQGALDDFQLLRLLKSNSTNIAAAPTTGKPIKFDPDRIYFKGHSQGSLTGALFLAAEPEVKAGILSGAGAVLIYSLLNKTSPVNIPQLIGGLLRDPVDEYHPLLSMLQAYLEQSDPANYGKYYFREPPDGFQPKSIFQSLGFIDTYAPVPNGKAQALCAGLQPINPMQMGGDMDGLALVNLSWGSAPTSNNVGNGTATGVLLEYEAPAGIDGHFVIFHVPAAIAQSNRFLATHAVTGTATLTAP